MTPKRPTPESKTTAELPLDAQIRTRAYELYEQRGKQEGREIDDWLQAEKEITEEVRGAVA